MPVEFIGFITNNNASETIVRSGPVLDPPYIETVAKAHELAGFDPRCWRSIRPHPTRCRSRSMC